jgi:hypothetical protein
MSRNRPHCRQCRIHLREHDRLRESRDLAFKELMMTEKGPLIDMLYRELSKASGLAETRLHQLESRDAEIARLRGL